MKTIHLNRLHNYQSIRNLINQLHLIDDKKTQQDIAINYFLFKQHEVWHDKFKEQLQEHKILLQRLNDESNIKKVIAIIKSIRQSTKREKNLIFRYGEKILKIKKNK